MNRNQRTRVVLTASLITALIIISLRYLSLPGLPLRGVNLSSQVGFLLSIGALLVANLLAAIPGALLMARAKTPKFTMLSAASVIGAFLPAYALSAFAFALAGWWLWAVTTVAVMAVSYVWNDFVLNQWKATSSRKLVVAGLVFLILALVSAQAVHLF